MVVGIRRVQKKPRSEPKANEVQLVGERVKHLRMQQKPYMTQAQLAYMARLNKKFIYLLEKNHPSTFNIRIDTLRKVANALGHEVFFTIKKRPSHVEGECQPSGPALPAPLKRIDRISARGQAKALSLSQTYWKKYRRRPRSQRRKETSDTPDLGTPQEAEAE